MWNHSFFKLHALLPYLYYPHNSITSQYNYDFHSQVKLVVPNNAVNAHATIGQTHHYRSILQDGFYYTANFSEALYMTCFVICGMFIVSISANSTVCQNLRLNKFKNVKIYVFLMCICPCQFTCVNDIAQLSYWM